MYIQFKALKNSITILKIKLQQILNKNTHTGMPYDLYLVDIYITSSSEQYRNIYCTPR